MLVHIPGCYGPYNLSIEVNNQSVLFSQIEDGDIIQLPLPANGEFVVQSITNSAGCETQLNVFESLSSPGNAEFISTDFCFGGTNDITFLGDHGVFSLVNDTTNATIDFSTGVISNASGNTTYLIKHQYCTSVYFDTIFVYHNDASFSSSNICDGGMNTVNVSGSLGTFSLIPPSFGATINPTSVQIINSLAGNNYTICHIVGNICADTAIQSISVIANDDPSFSITDFCVNSSNVVSITGNGGGVFSFSPLPSDGAIINSDSGIISNHTVGQTYSIKYVTNGECKDSSIQSVSVLSLPTAFVYGESGDLCINDSLPIHIALSGLGPWDFTMSNGFQVEMFSNVSSSPATVYVDNIGQYSIVTVSDTQCSNIGDTMSFVSIEGDSIYINSNFTNGCAPSEITFSTNLTGSDFDCVWTFGDGTMLSQCDMVTHTYSESGLYTIQFAVSSPRCQVDTTLVNFIEIYEDPISLFNFNPQHPSVSNNGVQVVNLSVDNQFNKWIVNDSLVSISVEPLIYLPSLVQSNDLCLIV